MKLAFDEGGSGSPLFVLLHGLGATRKVWRRLAERIGRRGSWIAPDLRGHGASSHASDYRLNRHAEDVAELVVKSGSSPEVVVVGHSMGGAVGLTLASGTFGVTVRRAFGLGIKVHWSGEELSALQKVAASQSKVFERKEEALTRYLKVSGLWGLVDAGSPEAETGVLCTNGVWRLANDPRAASVGAPPMTRILSEAVAPIHLACGDRDAMVSRGQLKAFDPDARDIPGGHNVMVENPDAVWRWIDGFPT